MKKKKKKKKRKMENCGIYRYRLTAYYFVIQSILIDRTGLVKLIHSPKSVVYQ